MVPRLVISPSSRARNLRRVGPSSAEVERAHYARLSGSQKRGKLRQVDAILPIVVVKVAWAPAYAAPGRGRHSDSRPFWGLAGVASQRGADQAFEAAFGGVRGHAAADYATGRLPRLGRSWSI